MGILFWSFIKAIVFGFIEKTSLWNGRVTNYNGILEFDISLCFLKNTILKDDELKENNNDPWSNKFGKYFLLYVPLLEHYIAYQHFKRSGQT